MKSNKKLKSFFEIVFFVLKVTFLGFGGGNAMLPIVRSHAVDQKKWVSLDDFDDIVVATNSLPGPSVIETISYICILKLGKFLGTVAMFTGMLPHLFLALILFFVGINFIPLQYLFVINAAVMPTIIALLISFGLRYIKKSKILLPNSIWILVLIFTIVFVIFMPIPFNIPAIVMFGLIVIIFTMNLIQKYKIKKQKKEEENKK